jgi:hypothetical protein
MMSTSEEPSDEMLSDQLSDYTISDDEDSSVELPNYGYDSWNSDNDGYKAHTDEQMHGRHASDQKVQAITPVRRNSGPQVGSPLFRLPQELRNQIYNYAFDTTPVRFDDDDLLSVIATVDFPMKCDKSSTGARGGFLLWMLSCKRICSEALIAYSKARTFAAMSYGGLGFQWMATGALGKANPLIFKSNIIQNLAILKSLATRRDRTADYVFLHGLQKTSAQDLCFETL